MKDKAALRREMKAARAAAEDRAAADERIADGVLGLPAVREGRTFFVYRSFGSEAGTERILTALLRAGKRVLLPRVRGREMDAVEYTGQPLVRGSFGIEEPVGEPYAGSPDVCIVPLLAADERFFRLGYGGGYYDRYFAGAGRRSYKVGICYDLQRIKTIPAEEHDVRLDAIVTEERVLLRDKAEE